MDKPEKNKDKHELDSATVLPDLATLSLPEMEALIARKRLEESQQGLRNPVQESRSPLEEILLAPMIEQTLPKSKRPASSTRNKTTSSVETLEQRFRPVGLEVKDRKKRVPIRERFQRLRNFAGYTLEGLVIIAVLVIFTNWILLQFGISINLLDLGRNSREALVQSARLEGPLLYANAPGVIILKPQATPIPNLSPTPEVLPTITPTNERMVIAASPTIERMVVATSPTPLPTNTPAGSAPIVAPTPTPVVVQPKPTASGKEPLRPDEASTIPARRLVIPRIELDMVVKEVTIDLDTWQVADFAVGHHLGTANPGQVGNMVLVGHRDVRGSVFLRLNELQAGDDFKVFTDKAVYRYIVTGISEVAPTEVDVMSPTSDPTATLITCTPIGYATRRLIVKARLQS